MKHWETHLYTYAVALTQGDKVKRENLEGMRLKAIKHGHSEAECRAVCYNPQAYISTGVCAQMSDFDSAVLDAVHNAPWIDPARQKFNIQMALDSLFQLGMVQPSCLKAGCYESSERGAQVLGYPT